MIHSLKNIPIIMNKLYNDYIEVLYGVLLLSFHRLQIVCLLLEYLGILPFFKFLFFYEIFQIKN